jgi:hypothetical protein
VFTLHITPIILSRLYGLLSMGSSIRRQRSTYVHFLLQVAIIVAADIPLGIQLSLRCHMVVPRIWLRFHQNSLNERPSTSEEKRAEP